MKRSEMHKERARTEKRRKYGLAAVAVLFLGMLPMAGCREEEAPSTYHVEYLNKEKNRIIQVDYEPQATDTEGLIQEFLAVLCSDSDNVECRKPIPNDVEVTSYSLEGELLTLSFDADYNNMSIVEEVLCRAAVVRTMTQIEGVECVSFHVGDGPLVDARGNIVGSMTPESFIENPGAQINSIQNTTLTLYFSNAAGDGLVREVRDEVYYSSNIALEKLVMEQLLGGTEHEGAKSAIPAGTRLVTISVVDGICYVNLDEGFRNQDYQVSEAVVIYSIVNSLSELPGIGKVQISVNGDNSGMYRDRFSLSEMYERNLDYVVSDETGEVQNTTEEE